MTRLDGTPGRAGGPGSMRAPGHVARGQDDTTRELPGQPGGAARRDIMGYMHVPTIQFLVGPDKVSEQTRYERGVKVDHHAPQSALCQKHADLAAAIAEVSADTTDLKAKMDAFAIAEA